MLIQTKIQIDQKDLEFIKIAHKNLSYKSISQYMREAITDKIREDRRKLRELKRTKAFEMMGKTGHENLFESLEGVDFEHR